MIRDRPDGATLRALAEAAIERGEDPALVARALAIAEREAASGTAPVEAIRARLARRYGDAPIETLLERLAGEIRAGAFDAEGPAQTELRLLLWEITLLKLAESNPEYLAAARREPI
jgi:Domain of unknown function (DUF6285)